MLHVFEGEAQRILGGGVDTDEWHEVLVPKPTTSQSLLAEPLQYFFQSLGHNLQAVEYPYHVSWKTIRSWVETVTFEHDLAVALCAEIDIGNLTGVDGAITHELDRSFF